ncbi:MAG: hypothetical protein Kow00129_00190 [Thermoleophilia bacterium]
MPVYKTLVQCGAFGPDKGDIDGLKGDLKDFGLAELLQVLSLGKRSGVLELRGERTSGRLVLQKGSIVDAGCRPGPGEDSAQFLRGEAAFFALMENTAGSFSFSMEAASEGRPAVEQTISRPIDWLLIEAASQAEDRGS